MNTKGFTWLCGIAAACAGGVEFDATCPEVLGVAGFWLTVLGTSAFAAGADTLAGVLAVRLAGAVALELGSRPVSAAAPKRLTTMTEPAAIAITGCKRHALGCWREVGYVFIGCPYVVT